MNHPTAWENVYIFISSTFNDMHAERDYLIKRVFPAVRAFCGEHRLNLLDVDLRWGITEEDAAKNRRVVEICLSNLDRCRPFFIGLFGQRRGWVPNLQDINPETLEKFPGLSRYLGRNSITELELIHGILDPMAEGSAKMRHAFLFRRDPSYLEAITDADTHAIYDDRPQPEAHAQGFFSRLARRISPKDKAQNSGLSVLDQIIAAAQASGGGQVSVETYQADWDPSARTPELSRAGGKDLSAGRLVNFRIGELSLSDYLIRTLEEAIRQEFPSHFGEKGEETPMDRELSRQETALFHATDFYIPRPCDEQKILEYFEGDEAVPYLLTAAAGTGKTSLLAHIIQIMKSEENPAAFHLFYRLAGTSVESSSAASTIESLCTEIAGAGLAKEEDVRKHRSEILLYFRTFLENMKKEPIRIIIDAVDQWSGFDRDLLEWIPKKLPEHVRLLISMKTEGSEEQRKSLREKGIPAASLAPFSGDEDKRRLIKNYLAAFLKDINEEQIRKIVGMKGSDNPLYLKIILNELRLHGSFDTLFAQLEKNYGTTPRDAFGQMISRLLGEQLTDTAKSRELTGYFLGILAYAAEPAAFADLPAVLRLTPELENELTEKQILDGLYIIARHLADFLMLDGGSAAYRYDSFRQAFRSLINEKGKEMFHSLLFRIYLNRAGSGGDPHYRDADLSCLESLAFHAVSAGESFTAFLLTDPWYVHRFVSESGALNAARRYRDAAERGFREYEYGRMADILSRHAARYDIGANPLFYEALESAKDLKLTRLLYARFRRDMAFPFYYETRKSSPGGLIPAKEVRLGPPGQTESDRFCYYRDWILQYRSRSDEIAVLDRQTGGILQKVTLRGQIQFCHADGEYLHVLYASRGESRRGAAETLRLPDFTSVFCTEEHPELPEGFRWYNFIIGSEGKYYAQACREGLFPENRLYELNSGEIAIQSSFAPEPGQHTAGSLKTEFCGSCMIEVFNSFNEDTPPASPDHFAPQQIRFWHIPDRKLFFETKEMYSCGYTTDGKRLWHLGVDTKMQMHCRVWEETPQGMELIRDQALALPSIQFSAVGAYDGILCVFFSSGLVMSFDSNLEQIGESRGNELIPTQEWYRGAYHRPLDLYRGQVTYVHKNRQCYFDRSVFETVHRENAASLFPEAKARRTWQVMSRNGFLFLLSDVVMSIDLRTMTAGAETDTKVRFFRYDTSRTWSLGASEVVFGSFSLAGEYCIQAVSLSTMKPVFAYRMTLPDNFNHVKNIFVLEERAGVVLESRYTDDPRTKYAVEFEIQICVTSDGIREPVRIPLPGRSDQLDKPLACALDGRILIARSEVLADPDHRNVTLFDVSERRETLLMQYEEKSCYHLLGDDLEALGGDLEADRMFCRNGELYLPMTVYRSENDGEIIMYIWDLRTGARRSYTMPRGRCRGLDEEKIYIYDRDTTRNVSVFRLRDGERLAVLETRRRESCRAVIQKGNDYLVFHSNDILEVFDVSTGAFRYSQYLSSEKIVDCPGTDYFYAGDLKTRHALYRSIQ